MNLDAQDFDYLKEAYECARLASESEGAGDKELYESKACQYLLAIPSLKREVVQKTIQCPGCGGEGEWEVECCSGANGCDCHGQPVPMGRCNICNGSGYVDENNYDRKANIRVIQGRCFIGRGPTSGY